MITQIQRPKASEPAPTETPTEPGKETEPAPVRQPPIVPITPAKPAPVEPLPGYCPFKNWSDFTIQH